MSVVSRDQAGPPPPPSPPPYNGAIYGFKPAKRRRNDTSQDTIERFWTRFNSKFGSEVPWAVLPDDLVAKRASAIYPKGKKPGESVMADYDAAHQACKAKVEMIAKECRRINQKYRDNHFDVDLYGPDPRFCLDGLLDNANDSDLRPRGIARVPDIFDKPVFFDKGATANDVRQGREGDCWFLSAVTAVTNMPNLIDNICVARDEDVGVYGFVFYRDGEWISSIIDDRLYLIKPDYNDPSIDRDVWDDIGTQGDGEESYRHAFLTGSKALYFARCRDENETWLPLLEKAYAKAHGDFSSIEGGHVGGEYH
jgi:hypothetical protein